MQRLIKSSHEFQQALGRGNQIIEFTTSDKKVTRYFAFSGGKLKSEPKHHKRAALTLTFSSASSARKLILSMARDPSDKAGMIEGINQGKIRIKGNIALLTWFLVISDYLPPKF